MSIVPDASPLLRRPFVASSLLGGLVDFVGVDGVVDPLHGSITRLLPRKTAAPFKFDFGTGESSNSSSPPKVRTKSTSAAFFSPLNPGLRGTPSPFVDGLQFLDELVSLQRRSPPTASVVRRRRRRRASAAAGEASRIVVVSPPTPAGQPFARTGGPRPAAEIAASSLLPPSSSRCRRRPRPSSRAARTTRADDDRRLSATSRRRRGSRWRRGKCGRDVVGTGRRRRRGIERPSPRGETPSWASNGESSRRGRRM